MRAYEDVCPTLSARDYKEPLMHPVSLNYRDGISGGGRSSTHPSGEGLQRNLSAEHHLCFGIDKSEHGQERTIANTITAREDRGVSVQNQTGTAVCIKIGDGNDRSFRDHRPEQT